MEDLRRSMKLAVSLRRKARKVVDSMTGKVKEYEDLSKEYKENGFCRIRLRDEEWLRLVRSVRLINLRLEEVEGDASCRLQDGWKCKDNDEIRMLATYKYITNFLEYAYEREAIPFQTLSFKRGSQQAMHMDSVHFNSRPTGLMCGVWIALEDVHQDAGPLFIVPGSHTRVKFVTPKDLGYSCNEVMGERHPQKLLEHYWNEQFIVNSLEKQEVILEQGDVLIWSANMMHGGLKVIDERKTRLSQVNHYFFKADEYVTPLYECTDGYCEGYRRNIISLRAQ